jgi:hypothetical protein
MKHSTHDWDFFIAHAGKDSEAAKELFGLLSPTARVFLDSACLQPGDDWDRELSTAQAKSKVTVVIVSQYTEAAFYEREEIAAAISMARNEKQLHRIVPVFLGSREKAESIPYGLRLKHALYVIGDDFSKPAIELLKLLKPTNEAIKESFVLPIASNIKSSRNWSPTNGTVAESNFRLTGLHSIKYIREEAFIAAIISVYIDEDRIFHKRIGIFDFLSINHPFELENVACNLSLKVGLGVVSANVTVGERKVLNI